MGSSSREQNYGLISLQETSTRLAQEFINSNECKNVKADIVLCNLMANGFAYGVYMGFNWTRDQLVNRGMIANIKRYLTGDNLETSSEEAADYCLRKKFRGVSNEDREVLRYTMIRGFKVGVTEYETQNPS